MIEYRNLSKNLAMSVILGLLLSNTVSLFSIYFPFKQLIINSLYENDLVLMESFMLYNFLVALLSYVFLKKHERLVGFIGGYFIGMVEFVIIYFLIFGLHVSGHSISVGNFFRIIFSMLGLYLFSYLSYGKENSMKSAIQKLLSYLVISTLLALSNIFSTIFAFIVYLLCTYKLITNNKIQNIKIKKTAKVLAIVVLVVVFSSVYNWLLPHLFYGYGVDVSGIPIYIAYFVTNPINYIVYKFLEIFGIGSLLKIY